MRISAIDRKILNCLQEGILLCPQPFDALAKKIGIEEDKLLDKIGQLKDKGIIRNITAGISHKKLGFKSSLIGMRVPLGKLDAITREITAYSEVTHCFLRDNDYNLWTVLIYKDGMLDDFLKKMAKELGRENIVNLKTLKQFKLKTILRF